MSLLSEIRTQRLLIVPFSESHLTDRYVSWLNNPEIVRYSEQRHRKHDIATCRAYFETMVESDNFFCAIEEICGRRNHIGNVSVTVDRPNCLADISIMIGERSAWGKGIGFEAWNAVLEALFRREGLRKVTAGTVTPNQAMIRIMKKSGMRPDGRRTAHYLIEGKSVDVVYYAKFADEVR